jgi:hypothetical protein
VSAVARPAAVRRKVESWLARPDGTDAIALRALPEWTDGETLTVGDVTVRVVPCDTVLAARAALHDHSGDTPLVLLTDLSEDELGDTVLARLSRQQVRSIDRWDLVRQVFGGADLHPGLVAAGRWAADALVDHAPSGGWPTPPGLLTRDHALGSLAAHLLHLPREQVDSAGLLHWSTDAAGLLRFTGLPSDTVDGLTAYLVDIAGPATVPILAAVRAGHGVDAVPLGLLTGALWPAGVADPARDAAAVAVARTRLEERYLGGHQLTAPQAHAYRDAAQAWIDRAVDAGDSADAHRMLHRAETIAGEIAMTELLAASDTLPRGLVQRLRRFAEAVRHAVPAGDAIAEPAAIAHAQAALQEVTDHRAVTPTRSSTATMAVRLLRWLATADPPPAPTPSDAV